MIILRYVMPMLLLLLWPGYLLSAPSEGKNPLYFAANKFPTKNIPPESPLCFKFYVENVQARLNEQLNRLKEKYSTLYDYKIQRKGNDHYTLQAKAREQNGNVIDFFYSSDPKACNQYQLDKSKNTTPPASSPAQNIPNKAVIQSSGLEFTLGNFIVYGDEAYYVNEIKSGDYKLFLQVNDKIEKSGRKLRLLVVVNNNGGLIDEALSIGKYLRSNNIKTAAAIRCASACIYVFAGGVERFSYMDTQFGLHQVRYANGYKGTVSMGQELVAQLFDYLDMMGVNPKIVSLQSSVKANDIKWINQYEANGFKLVTQIKENHEIDIPNLEKIAKIDPSINSDADDSSQTDQEKQVKEFITFMYYLLQQ